MFIAVYEFIIDPKKATTFRRAWLKTTEGIYREFGSLGSRLHATEDPAIFIGYAQWPDKQTWEGDGRNLSAKFDAARREMRECIVESKTIYELEVTDDYLQSHPFLPDF